MVSQVTAAKRCSSQCTGLKTERVDRRRYRALAEVMSNVFDCIQQFSNPCRRHFTLQCLSPIAFEDAAGQLRSVSGEPGQGQCPSTARWSISSLIRASRWDTVIGGQRSGVNGRPN